MKLEALTEAMPSGVIKMKSAFSKLTPEEQYEDVKRRAAGKNKTPMEQAKSMDRLFADRTNKIQRLVTRMEKE